MKVRGGLEYVGRQVVLKLVAQIPKTRGLPHLLQHARLFESQSRSLIRNERFSFLNYRMTHCPISLGLSSQFTRLTNDC